MLKPLDHSPKAKRAEAIAKAIELKKKQSIDIALAYGIGTPDTQTQFLEHIEKIKPQKPLIYVSPSRLFTDKGLFQQKISEEGSAIKVVTDPSQLKPPLENKVYVIESPSISRETMLSLVKISPSNIPVFAGGDNTISEFIQQGRVIDENLIIPNAGHNSSFIQDVRKAKETGLPIRSFGDKIEKLVKTGRPPRDTFYDLSLLFDKDFNEGLKSLEMKVQAGLLSGNEATGIIQAKKGSLFSNIKKEKINDDSMRILSHIIGDHFVVHDSYYKNPEEIFESRFGLNSPQSGLGDSKRSPNSKKEQETLEEFFRNLRTQTQNYVKLNQFGSCLQRSLIH